MPAPTDQEEVLEVYKLVVEMADRLSARRASLTSVFMTLNATLLAATGFTSNGVIASNVPRRADIAVSLGAIGLLLCAQWFLLAGSYRSLSAAKFRVLMEIEERLPLQAYTDEWRFLAQDLSRSLLRPRLLRFRPSFGQVERLLPAAFAAAYLIAIAGSL